MPDRASTMWSPGVLLRRMAPCTWPLASVTAWAGTMLASDPGSMTSSMSTGAPTIGLPKAISVTLNFTVPPGSVWLAALCSRRLTGPGGGDGLTKGTGPWAMIGPAGLGAMKPGAAAGVAPLELLLDDLELEPLLDDPARDHASARGAPSTS